MKNLKSQKGITLVALVITIIILIILAGISISIVLGEDGLIAKSKKGAEAYQTAATNEQQLLDNINAFINGEISSIASGGSSTGSISAEECDFQPDNKNWKVTNVKDALDWLYNN